MQQGQKQKKEREREEEESGRGKNVISPLFSLLNRLQPVCGVLWPNSTEPECLLANCPKRGVCQQMAITLDVQQTILPFIFGRGRGGPWLLFPNGTPMDF